MRLAYHLVLGLILTSCAHSETETRTPVQIKEDLRRAELHSPTMYLHVDGTLNDQTVDCTIQNSAKEADFQDVTIAVNYFNDSRQLIKSDLFKIGKPVPKGTEIKHQQKVSPPENYHIVSFSIRDAK